MWQGGGRGLKNPKMLRTSSMEGPLPLSLSLSSLSLSSLSLPPSLPLVREDETHFLRATLWRRCRLTEIWDGAAAMAAVPLARAIRRKGTGSEKRERERERKRVRKNWIFPPFFEQSVPSHSLTSYSEDHNVHYQLCLPTKTIQQQQQQQYNWIIPMLSQLISILLRYMGCILKLMRKS